ncbi:hypothetical protein TRFO_03069 [Tritrichomonas foetus]|uniref:SPIN90/Ldb17 leucine-rich domain-containing protein n=1 Tax=Tritrichomonas foetus TaxID=1144522 RepID=A0A1J4KU17_9EUKA|nr:hypothetical protein TRFO_03069 [Tritrichomonas foetus]|eukprot:OHT14777.1 hypothetical protein TRFO_03069 [Tritrichomonas foetus]
MLTGYKVSTPINRYENNILDMYQNDKDDETQEISKFPLNPIEFQKLIDDFMDDPVNAISPIIELAQHYHFLISHDFFIVLLQMLVNNENVESVLHLLNIISKFPESFWIDQFPNELVPLLSDNFIHYPETLTILTSLIHYQQMEKLFLNFDILSKLEINLNSSNNSAFLISIINFYKEAAKCRIAFYYDFITIYYNISKLVKSNENNDNLRNISIETTYLYIKGFIHVHRIKEMEKIPFYSEILEWINIQNNDLFFRIKLLKIIRLFTRQKKLLKFVDVTTILPFLLSSLSLINEKQTFIVLCSIYNILREGKKFSFTLINSSFNLLTELFNIYNRYGFTIQKEAIYVMIEYIIYFDSAEMYSFLQNSELISIFCDFLHTRTDDPDLLTDLLLCFINIYEAFEKDGKLPLLIPYFANDEFLQAIYELEEIKPYHYNRFKKKISSLLDMVSTNS